ncbi:ribbon-helix-helix protein, CopG family [Nocardia abscessus]|uniref:ribbon-helix-helix protein, CopG family n=1 Tax=Nocardia abscessus TaxID=120957 RepID=UPI002458BCBF|nr:ribbon-helix-helix protein, CopG family [Nocardia abscessus]
MAREGKGKTLQVRVDQDTADRFAAIARARRMSDSELLRLTIHEMLRNAEKNVDMLKAKLREEFEQATAALDSITRTQSGTEQDSTASDR